MTTASTNGFPQDPHDAAALYLTKGLAPIPLPPRSKAPDLTDWPYFRMTTDALDRYFPKGEERNIGILNGAPSSNIIDVDLDCIEALRAAPLLLPATGWIFGRKSATRSHWLYKVDRSLDTASESYRDLTGLSMLVELRGSGGQTVVPPSTHQESGERIYWETFTEPAVVPLGDLQQEVRIVAAASLLAQHWPAKGSRDDAALALSGGLVRARWSTERVSRFVEAVAVAAGDEEAQKRATKAEATARKQADGCKTTGWTRLGELLRENGPAVVRRVREWLGLALQTAAAPKTIRALESYHPFPLEALPSPTREFVYHGALALGCDPCFLALHVLAVVASAIGNTRTIELKRGWTEPSVIWSAIVADSGTLKSPAFQKCVAPLFRIQKKLHDAFSEAMKQYELDLSAHEDEKRRAKKEGTEAPEPPEKPVYRRVILSDVTIEKVAEVQEDNPRGILVARDELAGWLGSFTRYKGKAGGTDLPHWLEMFRAGTVIVDRKTGDRKHYFIERAATSITGGIQPQVLARAFTPDLLDAGGGARLILAMPDKKKKHWTDIEIAHEVEEAYVNVLDRLLALDFDVQDGDSIPYALQLSPDGRTAWIAYYESWAQEQFAAEGELAAAFSKLEGYAARFALLHHVVTHLALDTSDRRPVGSLSIEAGITLAHWFAGEARRIYATLTESDDQRNARRLVEWIHARGGKTTTKQLQKSNSRKYPTAEAAIAALDGLATAGYGQWVDRPIDSRGGRPTQDFVLHPTTDDTDETSSEEDENDGGLPTGTPDETPPPSDATLTIPGDFGVSSVSSVVGNEITPSNGDGEGCSDGGGVSSGGFGVSSDAPAYQLVRDQAGLDIVANALEEAGLVGLDLETTGLNPRADRIRLLSLDVDTNYGRFTYLLDCFSLGASPLFPLLADKPLVIHNGAFDLAFLARMGFTPGTVHDTMLLAQLLTAGTGESCKLAACTERYLARPLDKAEQTSDWSGDLSEEQLAYAATDASVLVPLYRVLIEKIEAAGLQPVAEIECRCLPAVVWMAGRGVALDADAWQHQARAAAEDADRLRTQLQEAAPDRPGALFSDGWNWDSPAQVKEALGLAGCKVDRTADDALAAIDHPLTALIRQYRDAHKRQTTYGSGWLKHVASDGRVYPSWRQLGAESGRMSCSAPNMQQLPRGEYRRCVRAPAGRVLVKADYSQIELRIAAKVSGDAALLEAYRRGEDLHTRTARSVLNVENVTKQDRQLAKALNFGLLYGMGARGFRQYAKGQYGLDLSEREAGRYRDAFFRSYPGLAAWHRHIRSRHTKETRTLPGRRRLLNDKTPDTQRLNTPVQGTGADGLKLALALLWERREQAPGAFPVLAVHDEIVVEADADKADAVKEWLVRAMMDAMVPMLEPVPVEVEAKVVPTWGGE